MDLQPQTSRVTSRMTFMPKLLEQQQSSGAYQQPPHTQRELKPGRNVNPAAPRRRRSLLSLANGDSDGTPSPPPEPCAPTSSSAQPMAEPGRPAALRRHVSTFALGRARAAPAGFPAGDPLDARENAAPIVRKPSGRRVRPQPKPQEQVTLVPPGQPTPAGQPQFGRRGGAVPVRSVQPAQPNPSAGEPTMKVRRRPPPDQRVDGGMAAGNSSRPTDAPSWVAGVAGTQANQSTAAHDGANPLRTSLGGGASTAPSPNRPSLLRISTNGAARAVTPVALEPAWLGDDSFSLSTSPGLPTPSFHLDTHTQRGAPDASKPKEQRPPSWTMSSSTSSFTL